MNAAKRGQTLEEVVVRSLRLGLLAVGTAAASALLASAVLDPLADGWRALDAVSARTPRSSPDADLEALLTGACALLVSGAWLWLAAAVAVTTCDLLRSRSLPGGRSGRAARPSVLRPPLVRALVATCLGTTALTVPAAAHAGPVAPGPVLTGPHLLAGLPAPDRPVGRLSGGDHRRGADREPGRGRAGPAAAAPRLHVAPGDCLWTLTAGLLPPDVPDRTVAEGWRLLYAANRAVVGPDPDLLRPGLALRIDEALLDLVRSAGGPPPRPVPSPVPGGPP